MMLAQINAAMLIGSSTGLTALIIGVIYWTSKTRMSKGTCQIVRDNNQREHDLIREDIKESENRAEIRHKELKDLITKNNRKG